MADTKEKSTIFREKSLEAIASPEKVDDYLRVTSPGVWLTLATVIVILAGATVWGFLGHIDSTVPAAVVSADGESVCYVPQAALESVVDSPSVTVNGEKRELTPSVLKPQVIAEDTDIYLMLAGKLSIGDVVYPVELREPLEDGTYSGTLVTETLTPFSLLFGE